MEELMKINAKIRKQQIGRLYESLTAKVLETFEREGVTKF